MQNYMLQLYHNYTKKVKVKIMLQASLPVLLVLTVITSCITSTLRGIYSKKYVMSGGLLWNFNFFQNLTCLLMIGVIYVLSGSSFRFSLFSVGLGALMAACNVVSLYALLKAFSLGTFSYTTVIAALSAIIPTLGGLLFGESFLPAQYIGIALMVLCIILSPEKINEEKKTSNGKWLFFCALAFLSSGGVGVVQKLHQKSSLHSAEMPALLLTSFAVATVFSGCMLLGSKKARADENAVADKSPFLMWMPALCGACFAFPHTINLVLAGRLPSVIMFPTVNLCPMILSMLFAVVFMKERLSVSQWIGIVVGILAAVFVSGVIKL